MSAIAAIWHQGSDAAETSCCRAMLDAQRRYGPDASAVESHSGAALGRALFRLTPEDAFDRQPLVGGGGRYMLVADVRLDNRSDLADALGVGADEMRTTADATLLLRAWEKWGEDVFPQIVGDYAFIVFDAHAQSLTLARDPLGQRPLFWSRRTDRVAAASMPAGLQAASDGPLRPDAGRVARLLVGLDAGERSFYAGIQRVEPGHIVRIERNRTSIRRYWQPDRARLSLPSFGDYVDAYREQLDRATAARLRRIDRPVAAHLSGGWDSSAVTATAARSLQTSGDRLIAYTSVPRTGPRGEVRHRFSDEGAFAGNVAAMYPNIDHHLLPGRGASPLTDIAAYPDLYGRPMVNLCNHVWLTDIRKHARTIGARVMLTGEIGNFTISNAPASLLADHVRAFRWKTWALESRAAVKQGRARIRGVLASSFRPWIPPGIWTLLEPFGGAPSTDAMTLLSPDWRARLRADLADQDATLRKSDHFASTLSGIRALDLGEYHKGVLGGWSIDKRDPTADVRVVEFMLSLPPDLFLKDGVRRPLARAALADRLPAAILEEKRKGYQAADWYEGLTADLPAVRALVDRIAADPVAADVIDVAAMRRLVDDWPQDGWNDRLTIARYRGALLHTLSAGHFIVAA